MKTPPISLHTFGVNAASPSRHVSSRQHAPFKKLYWQQFASEQGVSFVAIPPSNSHCKRVYVSPIQTPSLQQAIGGNGSFDGQNLPVSAGSP
jgi:hypothetical protein